MATISSALRRFYFRFKDKRWWHNHIYPSNLDVEILQNKKIRMTYLARFVDFQDVAVLSNQFLGARSHLILSGPSVNDIVEPARLTRDFCFTVNGSPALFERHGLKYDAYVVDDPRFVKKRGADVVKFAAAAKYCFLSYRSIFYLLRQGFDLSALNIYVFDYHFMPFRKPYDEDPYPFFASSLTSRIGLCDSVAYIVLQLAHGMGFKQAVLFGMDLSMSGRFYAEKKSHPQFLDRNWQAGIVEPMTLLSTMIKTGKLENWKTGKLENWKTGKLENWKTGRC